MKTPEELKLESGFSTTDNEVDYLIEITQKDAACESTFQAIKYCNVEYRNIIQQMHSELANLKRINKIDMERIIDRFSDIELGEDINPYLEDANCGRKCKEKLSIKGE